METPRRYHPLLVTLHWVMVVLVFFNLYFGAFVVMDPRNFAQMDTNLAIHMSVGLTILVLLIIRFFVRLGTKKPDAAQTENHIMDNLARLVHYGLYFFLVVMTISGLLYSVQSFNFQSIFLGQQRSGFGGGFPGGDRVPRVNAQGTPFAPGNFNGGGGGTNAQGTPFAPGNFNGGQGGGRGNFGQGGFGGGRFNNAGPGFLRGFRGPLLLTVHVVTAIILILLLLIHIGAALYHQFARKDNLIGRMWYGS